MRVVSTHEMKKIETIAHQEYGLTESLIIETVGLRGADYLYQQYLQNHDYGELVVMVGKGNNGADGLAIARHLKRMNLKVRAFLFYPEEECSEELIKQVQMGLAYGIKFTEVKNSEQLVAYFTQTQNEFFIIDAILGTGVRLPLSNDIFEIVSLVNEYASVTIAVDIATGVDGNTGVVMGPAIYASETLAVGYPKLGHFISAGAEHSKRVKVLDAGFPRKIAVESNCELLTPDEVRKIKNLRSKFAGKKAFGHTLVIGGSEGLMGALLLSSTAAIKVGSGLVTAMTWEELIPELNHRIIPEVMTRSIPREYYLKDNKNYLTDLDKYDSLVIGPGLGRSIRAHRLVKDVIGNFSGPIIVDADAINVLNIDRDGDLFASRKNPLILTPHLGEFSRFMGISMKETEELPFEKLKECIDRSHCSVLLKGASSYLAFPNGKIYINYRPNDGMATGGSGDVLAGILGGMLGQIVTGKEKRPGIFKDPQAIYDQACLSLVVHSLAGKYAAKTLGERPMTAGSIIEFLPEAFFEIDGTIEN